MEYSRPINVNDVDTDMQLGMYTWFPYQSSENCTDVNGITLLDSWVFSAQGHFTKKTNLFPGNISKGLNGCSMKAVVINGHWDFTTNYVTYKDSNGNHRRYIKGFESKLLKVVYEQMNMTFVYVPTPEGFKIEEGSVLRNLVMGMLGKEIYIALSVVGTHYSSDICFDATNPYYMMSLRWYVPCFIKYPR